MNQIPNIEEEKEEIIEPDKVFDCFDEGCEECTVCKYLNFREWAEGCAPAGSSIERNQLVEDYLKRKHQQLQKVHHDWLREEIVRLKDRQRGWLGNEEDGSDRHPNYDELQTIIDRYQSELDQEVNKICSTCGKRKYERGQTYTPGDECRCGITSEDKKD